MRCGMVNWRAKQIRQKSKASRTPGKTKGAHCQITYPKKFFASNPKAVKHKDYIKWHNQFKVQNG